MSNMPAIDKTPAVAILAIEGLMDRIAFAPGVFAQTGARCALAAYALIAGGGAYRRLKRAVVKMLPQLADVVKFAT